MNDQLRPADTPSRTLGIGLPRRVCPLSVNPALLSVPYPLFPAVNGPDGPGFVWRGVKALPEGFDFGVRQRLVHGSKIEKPGYLLFGRCRIFRPHPAGRRSWACEGYPFPTFGAIANRSDFVLNRNDTGAVDLDQGLLGLVKLEFSVRRQM